MTETSDDEELILHDIDYNPEFQNRGGTYFNPSNCYTSSLLASIIHGDINAVKKKLRKKCELNLNDNRGYTALHLAVEFKRVDILKILLMQPTIRRNSRNNNGETSLFLSLEDEANEEIVYTLINSGCDINIANNEGVTPLHLAARWNSVNVAHKLIIMGADVNVKDHDGYTPLHEAATKDRSENVYMLLYYNASANEKTYQLNASPFHMASNYERGTESAKYLLNYVADVDDVDASGFTPLHVALNSKSDFAKEIVEYGADVNKTIGETPAIHFSLFYETSDIFEFMWSRINHNFLLKFNYPLLKMFMSKTNFRIDQFLKCLYIIFESPFINNFLHQHTDSLFSCIVHKDISLDERVKVFSLFLSHGVTVYFNDICLIHDKYGFDQSLETILISGCCIIPNQRNRFNLLVSRICYNSLNMYVRGRDYFTKSILQSDRKNYYRFYYSLPECFSVQQTYDFRGVVIYKGVRTLLELSRDAVRAAVYKERKEPFLFNAYSTFSSLQIPTKVRDILFLKEPIFRDRGIVVFVG
ncbi:Ankyrin repeat-containing protein [Oryctes borbonicus]|uniref:Ankyrin repeat-containing protein n=1 Tax=Oryctes borbonicus TaxID=1629725 RepID=A0A0T6B622_9SCAR|nr:Ankyrin repeat-containing protein [Oryctes borbonicus]